MDRRKNQPGDGNPSSTGTSPGQQTQSGGESDQTAHEDPVNEPVSEPRANWQYKERLPIQEKMTHVITETIKASENQLELYRRKLRKMQLGS